MLARRAPARFVTAWTCRIGTWIPAGRLPTTLFNQFLATSGTSLHVQWFARLVAHKSTAPSAGDNSIHHERPSALWSTARVQGQCWAPPGERGIFWLLWLVRISTAVRLPALSIRQEHTSRVVAILTQWQASMVARMQGRASQRTTLGVDTDVVSSTRDACKS
jgi:hypothetical protein